MHDSGEGTVKYCVVFFHAVSAKIIRNAALDVDGSPALVASSKTMHRAKLNAHGLLSFMSLGRIRVFLQGYET